MTRYGTLDGEITCTTVASESLLASFLTRSKDKRAPPRSWTDIDTCSHALHQLH